MTDALGSIFHMLIEMVRFLRLNENPKDADFMDPKFSNVAQHSNDVIVKLAASKDQMIRELYGRDPVNTIGPVVTPEAITIKVLERLVYGVSNKERVDIIQLYERCLESLVG